MPSALLALVVLASLPSMDHGVAPVRSGVVVAAPHEGFDAHTGPLARSVARRLDTGWVVARSYRVPAVERWYDVNRPTQKRWRRGKVQPAKQTRRARRIYSEYQRRLGEAAAREPVDLLVELHGHARREEVDGKRVKVQVIELATRGFSAEELRALRARYVKLVQGLPKTDRVPLYVEQLDPTYTWRGRTLKFYFRASGAKTTGSLRPQKTRRALHFELPSRVRFEKARRRRYARLLADLLHPLLGRE